MSGQLSVRQAGPHTFNGRIYVAESSPPLGPKERLEAVFGTPSNAYDAIVEHAGGEPPGGEPDWPETFGDDIWAWDSDGPYHYAITEWVPSGVVD